MSNYIIIEAGFSSGSSRNIYAYAFDSTIIERTSAGYTFKRDMDIKVTINGTVWGGSGGWCMVSLNNNAICTGGFYTSTTTPLTKTVSVSTGDILSITGGGVASGHVYPHSVTVAVAE